MIRTLKYSTRRINEITGDIGETQVNVINEDENASEINDNIILKEIQKEDEDETFEKNKKKKE